MYSKKDIVKDVFKVEGINIDFDNFPDSLRFLTKYSEHNKTQMPSNGNIVDLESNIKKYMAADQEIKDELLLHFLTLKDKIERKEKVYTLLQNPIFLFSANIIIVIIFLLAFSLA